MKFIKEIQTPMATVRQAENGIIYSELVAEITEMEQATRHAEMLKEHFGELIPLKNVVDSRKLKKTNKEVRQYFSGAAMKDIFGAMAVIVGSGLSKVAVNLFLKFSRPPFPTKMFTSIEKATEWMQEQEVEQPHG